MWHLLLIAIAFFSPGLDTASENSSLSPSETTTPAEGVSAWSAGDESLCVAGYTANVYGSQTFISPLPAGWYRVSVNSQLWSYSPGRWFNAYGDPNKTNTGGCVLPTARFGQLIMKARVSPYFPYQYLKFSGNGQLIYHAGGNMILRLNDRPNEYGDNAGVIQVTLTPY